MKHRHLVDGVGYTPAAVEDILDRGKPPDWAALRDAVVADSHGTVAQTVLDVCRSTYMYGTSALWSAFIAALHHKNDYLVKRSIVPDAILVGGTAAAMHVQHRFSHDDDHVVTDCFAKVLQDLETQAGWTTDRIQPPVLILGNLDGVETGIRNLIRAQPLDVETYETSSGPIVLPTLAEMTRVKAWLCVTRNATRDYVDFVALADRIEINSGIEAVIDALSPMDRLYPQANGTSVRLQLAKQLAEPRPKDLGDGDLSVYRLIADRWKAWDVVKRAAERYGVILLEEFARRQ